MAKTEAGPPTPSGTRDAPMRTGQQPSEGPDRPLLSWPVATAAILAVVLVLLGGGALLLRQVSGPATPAALAPTTVLTSAPTVSAPLTTPPQTIAPSTLTPANKAAATSMPTPVPTSPPTTLPMTATRPAGAAATQSTGATALPTVPPELRREVEAAYTQYWDTRAQAVWTLDPLLLDAVATGDELLALRRDVDQLRADGRAIKAEVQHQYTVIRVDGDEAQILDRLRDFSVYVNASSKEPLPGQVRPDEANAPLTTSLYFLKNSDGVWKVERGEAYANN